MTIVGPQVLAEEFGVTPQRVSQLVQDGMPRLSRGKYDLEACKQWRSDVSEDYGAERSTNIADERTRYYAAQADTAEFRLAKEKESHIAADVFAITLANVVTELVISLDGWVDQAPGAEQMDLRRECAWRCREQLQRAVESACGDTPGVQGAQATGLRNRRQVR